MAVTDPAFQTLAPRVSALMVSGTLFLGANWKPNCAPNLSLTYPPNGIFCCCCCSVYQTELLIAINSEQNFCHFDHEGMRNVRILPCNSNDEK